MSAGLAALWTPLARFIPVGCTSGRTDVLVTVSANPGAAFHTGSAEVRAEIFGCTQGVCGTEQDSATVNVRR